MSSPGLVKKGTQFKKTKTTTVAQCSDNIAQQCLKTVAQRCTIIVQLCVHTKTMCVHQMAKLAKIDKGVKQSTQKPLVTLVTL